jgi:hypothetical protein
MEDASPTSTASTAISDVLTTCTKWESFESVPNGRSPCDHRTSIVSGCPVIAALKNFLSDLASFSAR